MLRLADSEQAFRHGTIIHKLEPKAFEQNDNDDHPESITAVNGIVDENQKRVLCQSEAYEDERDSVLYMDKSVTERELPELIVCYQDSTYQVVKDICIDDGVPSHNKFLFDMDAHEKDVNLERVGEEVNLDVPIPEVLKSLTLKETLDPDALNHSDEEDRQTNFSDVQTTRKATDYTVEKIPNVLKSLPEKEKMIHDSLNCSNEGDSRNDLNGGRKKTADEELKKIFTLEDLLPTPKLSTDLSHHKSSVNSMDEAEPKSLQRPGENAFLASGSVGGEFENGGENILTGPALVAAAKESHDEAEEAVSANPSLISTPEQSDSKQAESAATHLSDSVLEEPTNHTMNQSVQSDAFNLDTSASAPSSSGTEKGLQNPDSDHLGINNLSRHGDPDDQSSSSRLQYVPGETSFSASGPLSGLISYLGPIAYSGSLSLRSDSSTTSARSFAFPVLQSEWNSSPVRMARADRRHRGWRHRLLCCRF